ncbi:hypothetical protein [Aquimarina algiphila]|uniref:hypothetical protein n=1 Tax=Aquimarina algiphila TaxID=2047982 RepID=UPI00232F5632|nr:hypothetical protein [Aquimarina algiphila]
MKKVMILAFCLVFNCVFSQENKKDLLVLRIDNQENDLFRTQQHNGCVDVFYVKELSKYSTLYGFKTREPKSEGGQPSKDTESFSTVFDNIREKGRAEFLKFFSKYYLIFVEKESGGGDDDYVYYHVVPFIEAI